MTLASAFKAARSFVSVDIVGVLRVLLLALPLTLPLHAVHAQEAAFSQAELDQMLAPVALYPDTVLSHVLIAATYPLEIVQAARWSRDNPGLKGADAVAAVEDRDWDPSVKALVAFPDLLQRMDEDLEWTQQLGDALLAQEEQVLDSVQGLRQRAYDAGTLDTMEHVEVVREAEAIIIEPAVREIVYVPYYDTRIVYGHWWWPAYPPVYWYYPGAYYGVAGFYWGSGIRISPWFYFSSFHWHRRHVVVVHHHHHHYHRRHHYYSSKDIAHHHNSRHWQHNPRHRRGVAYRDWPQRNTARDSGQHRHHRGDGAATRQRHTERHPDTGRRLPAIERNTQRRDELRQQLSATPQSSSPSADRPTEQAANNRRLTEQRNRGVQHDPRRSHELRRELSERQQSATSQRERTTANRRVSENRNPGAQPGTPQGGQHRQQQPQSAAPQPNNAAGQSSHRSLQPERRVRTESRHSNHESNRERAVNQSRQQATPHQRNTQQQPATPSNRNHNASSGSRAATPPANRNPSAGNPPRQTAGSRVRQDRRGNEARGQNPRESRR